MYWYNTPQNDIYKIRHKIPYDQIYCALLRISELMESGKIGICKVHPNALAI